MQIKGIHHVTLLVEDMPRAAWFYGQVLGLEEKGRPDFDFPGLFYEAGKGQEIHLIVAARPLPHGDLYIERASGSHITRRHIHRHAALYVPLLDAMRKRLVENDIEILLSETDGRHDDELAQNMMAGWRKMYGGVPLFCEDPFGNLLEFVPMNRDA